MSATGVFVSYNHADKPIADAIVQSLTSISGELQVFIDHESLEAGDEYDAKLSKNIRDAQWFFIVYSGIDTPGKNMNWCFYEAGQFRAKLDKDPVLSNQRDRICYLYDGQRPSQLSKYQGIKVSPINKSGISINLEDTGADSLDAEDTELFNLFKSIITESTDKPLRDISDPNVRKLMRSGVRLITRTFLKNQPDQKVDEIVFQPRVSFMLKQGSNGLTGETQVNGYERSLATIFGLAENSATWEKIKQSSRLGSDAEALWVGDVEAASQVIANGRIPAQTEALCIAADGRFYRPLVARYELFTSGIKCCYLGFIPTRNRRFSLGMRSSLLLSGLILSIRFRQRIFPIVDDMADLLHKDPPKAKMDLLNKFQKELTAIENEAVEFGLPMPEDEFDDPPLLNAFREGKTKDQLRSEILSWYKKRSLIIEKIVEARSPTKEVTPVDASNCLVQNLSNLRKTNGEFIMALTQELIHWEKIEGGEGSKQQDSPSPMMESGPAT